MDGDHPNPNKNSEHHWHLQLCQMRRALASAKWNDHRVSDRLNVLSCWHGPKSIQIFVGGNRQILPVEKIALAKCTAGVADLLSRLAPSLPLNFKVSLCSASLSVLFNSNSIADVCLIFALKN